MSDFNSRMAKKATPKKEAAKPAASVSTSKKKATAAEMEALVAPRKVSKPKAEAVPKHRKANRARGELKYYFNDKEILLVPSFRALQEVEEVVAPLFDILDMLSSGKYKIHNAIEIIVAMNEGDFVTREEVYYFLSEMFTDGRVHEFGLMMGECVTALVDPKGLLLTEVSIDEAQENPN